MKKGSIRYVHIISDFLTASCAWALFYLFRKFYLESAYFGYKIDILLDTKFFLGVLILPVFWIIIYHSGGHYKMLCRKTYAKVIGQTFLVTLFGVVIIFFAVILDDVMASYKKYYLSFLVIFILHYILTLIPRLIITAVLKKRIRTGKLQFNTLIIGSGNDSVEIYQELSESKGTVGNNIVGFIHLKKKENPPLSKYIYDLGGIEEVEGVLKKYQIEEIIIAIEESEKKQLPDLINMLEQYDVIINVIPSMYDILTGRVKITTLFNTPLVQVSTDVMPVWQENLKQFIDIMGSLVALILFLPLGLILALLIKFTSKGPVFYSHQRIGRYGKAFKIIKFRSMYIDAERNGPELTKKNDERTTPIGRFMRKYRMDEIPNFYNVLRGDMSLVGPRPERQYYIDQIVKKSPQYKLLHKVKPGITSWGQVKYGYAENVDQMIKRLRYDLLYIQNRSIYIDIKILYYTLLVIFKGRGI
ncbi:MAG: sugar transferase [Bacteroidales bacterium]|nr:sugar transferase [Bacteroidales bacterium]